MSLVIKNSWFRRRWKHELSRITVTNTVYKDWIRVVEFENLYKGVQFLESKFTKFLYTFINMIPKWERVEFFSFGGSFGRD